MKLAFGIIFLCVVLFFNAESVRVICDATSCANTKCKAATAETCENGDFKPKGGLCGCCPTCEKYLKEGDSCVPLLLGLMGIPFTPCGPSLMCSSDSGECVEKPHKSVDMI